MDISRNVHRLGLLFVIILTGIWVLSDATSVSAQTSGLYVPLPHDCEGVTPPGETPPLCCVYGYVYYDSQPVAEVQVTIESAHGTWHTTTVTGPLSLQPYYQADLSSGVLAISPGDWITITVTHADNIARAVYQVAPGGQQVDVVIVADAAFGDGSDGNLSVASGQTMTVSTTSVNVIASGTVVTPVNSEGFSVGDVVFFHQTQGTANAGRWEFGQIAAINSPTRWTLTRPLVYSYDSINGRAQAIKTPQYHDIVVEDNGILTMPAWDGSTGGILVLRANGTVTVYGTIDAEGGDGGHGTVDNKGGGSGGGFRGGNNSTDGSAGGRGESYAGNWPSESRDANYSGGGGSEHWDKCGGGGGNGMPGISGWPNDSSGGYGYGGESSGTGDLKRMFFGGGGGGGKGTDAGGGGAGGGIIVIVARELACVGCTLSAHGGDSGGKVILPDLHAAGGAGAGGSIFLNVMTATLGTNLVNATGGGVSGVTEGRGGVGRIRIEYYNTLSGDTNPPASEAQISLPFPPIATINTVYVTTIQGQEIATFRGSATSPKWNGASITEYAWRSDRNGLLSTQANFTRTASSLSPGEHIIYFKAKDSDEMWSEEISTTLMILPPQEGAPIAAFIVTPTRGYTTTIFSFDASGCTDDEDLPSTLEVRWDWEDDGIYDTAWSTGKTITHTYLVTGVHAVRLEVRDTNALTDTITHDVIVSSLPGPSDWLFMLYLDGEDVRLYSWMWRALHNLEAMALNPGVTVVALLDSPGYRGTWRYQIQPGGQYTDGINRWAMGELNMGDPQTLQDFITWARDTYIATHTYLAVADHGRGTTGIAWDGEDDFITVAELRTALRMATGDGIAPLDIVHYDACLMAMLEDAYQIRDYARYMVASENLGWSAFAYHRYVLHATADTSPAILATAIADEYFNELTGYPRTISAFDLGQAEIVAGAVTTLATALQAELTDNVYAIGNTRLATQKFDSRDYYVINTDDEYLDLYDLARLLKQNVPGDTVQIAAQAVMDAVDDFVIAEHHASGYYRGHYLNLDNAHGVSIYFPPLPGGWDYDDYMMHVFDFTAQEEWDEFLMAYFGMVGTPPESPVDPGVPPTMMVFEVYLPVVLR